MTYHRQLASMGTRLGLVLPSVTPARGDRLVSRISLELEKWEQALSIHRADSSAMLVNRQLARTQSAVVDDPLLWQALQLAEEGCRLTQGWFNVACGRLYGAYKQNAATVPSTVSNYANVRLQLDEPQRRLSVDNAHALLDFGGLGKGLALDDIKRLLLEEGVQSCFVSFGESSILALGRHPHGNFWPVAVNHPFYPDQRLEILALHNRFLTLSSSVANGATGGGLLAHLVNPKDGLLIDELRTVATVSESGAMGEMISTAKLVAAQRWSVEPLLGDRADSCQLFIHKMDSSTHSA